MSLVGEAVQALKPKQLVKLDIFDPTKGPVEFFSAECERCLNPAATIMWGEQLCRECFQDRIDRGY
jgi:hypothetical protein